MENNYLELRLERIGSKIFMGTNIDYFDNSAEDINYEEVLEMEEEYKNVIKLCLNNTF